MDTQIVNLNAERVKRLNKLLFSLRKQEQDMKNPLLKEWFVIRNQIRALERNIKEMKNEKNH